MSIIKLPARKTKKAKCNKCSHIFNETVILYGRTVFAVCPECNSRNILEIKE